MVILITLLVIAVFAIIAFNHINYMNKQKNRVYNSEYTQRFITAKRNGYNWGMK